MRVATSYNQQHSKFKELLMFSIKDIELSKPPQKNDVSTKAADQEKVEQLEKFKKLAEQGAHDMDTPLVELEATLDLYLKNLPEKTYAKLKNAVIRIKKITRSILEYSPNRKLSADHEHILVSQTLTEVIEQNEFIYSNVEFKYLFDQSFRFTFIYGNALVFERMMRNLIKNSVEALEGKGGIVNIGFSVKDDNVEITIEDNSKGMPQEVANKLMRGESVSTTKKTGHGIGTQQIRDALAEFGGTQLIESTLGVGTKITLSIPESDKPKDFIESVSAVLEDNSKEKACDDSSAEVVADMILLDDSWSFVEILGAFLKSRGIKKVDSYCSPSDLLKNLSKYSVNTKIFMDNDFKSDISGKDLARELAARGFKNIYILSGSPTKYLRSKYPEGTKFMEKGSASFIDDLIYYAKMS